MALILISATPGHIWNPGINSIALKQLAYVPQIPWFDQPVTGVGPNR
jgi:hypothetical protein